MNDLVPKPERAITIKEARKILGQKYEHISDEYIEKLILEMMELSDIIIEIKKSGVKIFD